MKNSRLLLSLAVFAVSALMASAQEWAPVGDKIKSPWAEQVTPASVLPEYPRPQMVRSTWMNLNGLWSYAITPSSEQSFVAQGKILVPFAVESALSGVGKMVGEENALWYERSFTLPSSWKGKDVLLHFGAVDWYAQVWVNGQMVGEHKGGYDPFSFNITSLLKRSGENILRVRVEDPTDMVCIPRGKQVCRPSKIWYTPVTGIWQTVWLEPVAKTYVESYYAVSNIYESTISVDVNVAAQADGDVVVVEAADASLTYDAEKTFAASKVVAKSEVKDGKAVLKIADAKLWSPDSPYIYGLKISVLRKGKVVDSVQGYTAMRELKAKEDYLRMKRFALNGQPIFMFGPLDQGWWPDGLYTAPTDEALRYDIQKTKEWGWNMIRKHIKVEPARWYYWCDVIGLTVWQDMPCIGDHASYNNAYRHPEIAKGLRNKWENDSFIGSTQCVIPQEYKDNYYNEWKEIIKDFKGFPSIVVWVPFNEGWGQFDTPEVVKFTRKQDPTRLIDEASGGAFLLSGDIQDCHHYPHPLMRAVEGKMVNVIGEYGGIGYPVEGHLWQQDKNWGYGTVMTSGEQVMKDYARYAEMLKDFIKAGCSGAVYTQTTDVEVEVNGIMTYDRKVIKVNETQLAKINRSVIDAMSAYDVQLIGAGPFRRADTKAPTLYTIKGGNLTMQVTSFGARVVSLWTPDRYGRYDDIEIGYGKLSQYVKNKGERYLGAAVGPVANRIGKGRFTIDGEQYSTPLNNNGNTLHGGEYGVDMLWWDVLDVTDNSITFALDLKDGLDGFPGNRHIEMKYELTEDNQFVVTYKGTTDKATPFNPSHHSFFNLTGKSNRTILNHVVKINASKTTPVDAELIPTGEIVSLDGSPLDFREPKAIGRDIAVKDQQLANGCGYDHNWCLDRKTASDVEFAASVYEPESGRYMEVWTDQPGIQFYSGNFFDGSYKDKYGRPIVYRGSIALETQKYPDAVNHPNFPSTILRPGETYTQTCIYKFSVK